MARPASETAQDPASEVPREWIGIAADIIRAGTRKVLVLGPVDGGKSTFCRLLLTTARRAGTVADLVDADLGQKMVGPPSCVTLGRAASDGAVNLSDLAFAGTMDPVSGWRDLVHGAVRLLDAAQGDKVVINTDGFVTGPGLRQKNEMISALAPELIVSVGGERSPHVLFASHPRLPVVRLPVSPQARRKTQGERRALRRQAFGTYFADAREVAAPLQLLLTKGPTIHPPARLLVGFYDSAGGELGLGIITAVDIAAGIARCLTSIALPHPVQARWGAFLLDDSYSERPIPL